MKTSHLIVNTLLKAGIDKIFSLSGNQITFGSPPPANDGATNGHIVTVIHNLHKLGE